MIKVIRGTTGPLAEKPHAQSNPAPSLTLEERLFLTWKEGDVEQGRTSPCKSVETKSKDLPVLDVATVLKGKLQRRLCALPRGRGHARHCSKPSQPPPPPATSAAMTKGSVWGFGKMEAV